MIRHIPFFVMIILLSPAKIQQTGIKPLHLNYTQPLFLEEAGELVELMRSLDQQELSKLLQVNRQLAGLTLDRYLQWHLPFSPENALQAAFLFDGEVFRGLNASTWSDEELSYAQDHLRILSGLYGLLRPLDLVQPYRLEVSTRLKNPAGNDLYPFWREKISNWLLKELNQFTEPRIVLNLASAEYFKMTKLQSPGIQLIDMEFYQYSEDKFRQVVIYTKKARGLMASYVIRNKIQNTEDLKGFSEEGYWFDPHQSTDSKLVYVR
jgi:cytoplasmic iron level regulating protein YaaA (DUF328/UPF0246 family)